MWPDYFAEPDTMLAIACYFVPVLIVVYITALASRWCESSDLRLAPVESSDAKVFFSDDIVITTGELNYSHGNGLVIPAGERLRLVAWHNTTAGARWSAYWQGTIYVFPIPEDLIELASPARSLVSQRSP